MTSKASGRRQPGASAAARDEPDAIVDGRAPLGPTVALTVALAIAAFTVVLAGTLLVVEPTTVPGFEATQRQDAETALFLVAYALILPLAVATVPRLADTIVAGPNRAALSFLGAAAVGTLAVAITIARVLPGEGAVNALAAAAIWWPAAAFVLARACRPRAWAPLLHLARRTTEAWWVAGGLLLVLLLALSPLESISLVALAVAGAVAVALVTLRRRTGGGRRLELSRGWGLAADVAIVSLIALTLPDLVVFSPEEGATGQLAGLKASVIQFHQDFLLGPANQVLAGDTLLVDTASQYGVAPIYLIAAWSELAPIGYGTLGFLDGLLYVLTFAAGYAVLRAAGVSRPWAAGALVLAVVTLIYNLVYPVGGLLQHGPLRFGLPMAIVLGAVLETSRPAHARLWACVQLFTLGLAAIWALEAFAYTLVTFGAVACLQVRIRGHPGRGWLVRRAALGLVACLTAHLLLALATLVAAGQLPDWGQYLDYLDALLVGRLADNTFDFPSWSPGLAVAAGYAASAAGIVLVALRGRELLERESASMVGLAGTTAYGIALYTYFDNRSAADILPYVCFPLILMGCLWLSLLLRGALTQARPARLGGLVFGLAVALLALATAWSSIGERFPQTPLGYLAPGGESLSGAMRRLWEPPPIDSRAPQGQALLDRHMLGQRRVLIVVSPELGIEILIRGGRASELPFGDPVQDFFAGHPTVAQMRTAIADLSPGDRVLLQDTAFDVLEELKADPARNVLADPLPVDAPNTLTGQQQWILQHMSERFNLRVLERDELGFLVVSLEPRR